MALRWRKVFGPGHADGLQRAEHLADETRDFARRGERGLAVLLDAPAGDLGGDDHDKEGQDNGDGNQSIDACHDDQREDRKCRVADHERQVVENAEYLLNIVAKPADGLAR
jgi:hypothetical protein